MEQRKKDDDRKRNRRDEELVDKLLQAEEERERDFDNTFTPEDLENMRKSAKALDFDRHFDALETSIDLFMGYKYDPSFDRNKCSREWYDNSISQFLLIPLSAPRQKRMVEVLMKSI